MLNTNRSCHNVYTHRYCIGKVFLAVSVAQNTANVEQRGVLSAVGLLEHHTIVESENYQGQQAKLSLRAPHSR